jgi:hypothetical protein
MLLQRQRWSLHLSFWNHQLKCKALERFSRSFDKQLKELPPLPHENLMAVVQYSRRKENSRQTEKSAMKATFFSPLRTLDVSVVAKNIRTAKQKTAIMNVKNLPVNKQC